MLLTMQVFGSVSPCPMLTPRQRHLSVNTSLAGEDRLISTVLPSDLVVSILADRLLVRTLTFSWFISKYCNIGVHVMLPYCQ